MSTALQRPAPHSATDSPLDELLGRREERDRSAGGQAALVGDCLDTRHPVLIGRALIRYTDAVGRSKDEWLPTLHGLSIRAADRVLVLQPANWPEPIIVGVVDGFAARPDTEPVPGPTVTVLPDQAVRVLSAENEQLLEVRQEETGLVVRLLREDVAIDLAGRLRLSARAIELQAKQGGVNIKATDDVVVEGEAVRLN
jgi:hypothetical protein